MNVERFPAFPLAPLRMQEVTDSAAYTYTLANLLSSVVHAGVGTSTMTWDADTNRVSFTSSSNNGLYQFVYDTTAGIPAVIEEVLPNTSSVYYIREPNGALIARIVGEVIQYYHFDALGSTRLLTSGTGTVTDTYSYDAWGNVTAGSGNTTAQPYQYVGQLGYYTHYQDTNLSLLQLGVRFYDPAIGRFTQKDPARSGLDSYAYVGDNPVARMDPAGLDWITIDFVYHYFFGKGAPVDLADVGLLDDYQDFVGWLTSNYKLHLKKAVKARAKAECGKVGGNGTIAVGLGYNEIHENMYAGDDKLSNPFYAIGGHTLYMESRCKLTINCCRKTVSYQCKNTFSFYDMFTDPLSMWPFGKEWDMQGATAYVISAFWTDNFNGGVGF